MLGATLWLAVAAISALVCASWGLTQALAKMKESATKGFIPATSHHCVCRGPPENGRERPHHHRQRPFSLATSYPLYLSRASLCTLRGPPGSGRERPSGGRGDTATCLVTATADSTVNFCVSIRLITFVSLSQLCPISLDYPGFTFFTQGWLCAVKQGVRHLFGPRLPLTKSDIL